MRKNTPITNTEHKINPKDILVSKTDLKGKIIYANIAFCDIAGFTQDELEGKPHNLLRHPDMPPSAFKDLWNTIQEGRPWTGLVKNRCKNGDYYWVVANVSPEYDDNGHISGYISVRTAPSQEQITFAENLYKNVNNGKAHIPETLKSNFYSKMRLKSLIITAALTSLISPANTLISHFYDSPLLDNISTACSFLTLTTILILAHKIIKPLEDIVTGMQRIVEGNFTIMPSKYMDDEIGDISDDMKNIQSILQFEIF